MSSAIPLVSNSCACFRAINLLANDLPTLTPRYFGYFSQLLPKNHEIVLIQFRPLKVPLKSWMEHFGLVWRLVKIIARSSIRLINRIDVVLIDPMQET